VRLQTEEGDATGIPDYGSSPEAFAFKKPFPSTGSGALLDMVCGLPGSGITKLAKQLAATLPATRFSEPDLDRFADMFEPLTEDEICQY